MNHFLHFDSIILFFVLGILASWAKSDLHLPDAISKFLSIFLLLSLGLKGGHEVRIAESLSGFVPTLILCLTSCLAIPLFLFFLIKRQIGIHNAAALSASYGSISAITFIAAQGVLENESISYNGYLVAIMAIMELPAILIALGLHHYFLKSSHMGASNLSSLLASKSVVLLFGGFLIGLTMNEKSWMGISPIIQDAFKGVLLFFLLDLGVVAQKQLDEAWKFKWTAVVISMVFPLLFGTLTLIAGHALNIERGDLVLMSTLVGSASYIAAPAAMKSSIPSANPGLYLALPLALTFPMNLLFGIPYYLLLSDWLQSIFPFYI